MSNGKDRRTLVARSEGHLLHASRISWIRGFNNHVADGPQGFEDDDAIHSRRPTSEKCAFSEFCPQIGHIRDTAANTGSRKLLILMVGARGFEPPTSRSRTERSTRLSHAPTSEWIIGKATRGVKPAKE